MLGAAEHGDEEVTVQAQLFAAVFKRERGAIDFAGLGIEDLSTGPPAAILHKSRHDLEAHERAVFQVPAAEVAGGMRNRGIKELLDGSEELSVLFADLDDARYLARRIVDGLPSAHWGWLHGIRRGEVLRQCERKRSSQRGDGEKQHPGDDAEPGKGHELRLRAGIRLVVHKQV